MRKVVLYIAMSLDGFIASENGSVDWLIGQEPDNQGMGSYEEFISDIDTVILGYTTYHQILTELSPNAWPYSEMQSYVLTHRNAQSSENIHFVNAEVSELVKDLKENDGKDIWICGGASVANQLIKNDMIDIFRITIIPTILGKGLPLFNPDNNEIKLKLMNASATNGITELIYERR